MLKDKKRMPNETEGIILQCQKEAMYRWLSGEGNATKKLS